MVVGLVRTMKMPSVIESIQNQAFIPLNTWAGKQPDLFVCISDSDAGYGFDPATVFVAQRGLGDVVEGLVVDDRPPLPTRIALGKLIAHSSVQLIGNWSYEPVAYLHGPQGSCLERGWTQRPAPLQGHQHGSINMCYSKVKAHEADTKMKYDYVVRIRCDVAYSAPLQFPPRQWLESHGTAKHVVGQHMLRDLICDFGPILASRAAADIAFMMYEPLISCHSAVGAKNTPEKHCEEKMKSPECMWTDWMLNNGVKIIQVQTKAMVVKWTRMTECTEFGHTFIWPRPRWRQNTELNWTRFYGDAPQGEECMRDRGPIVCYRDGITSTT